MCGGTGDSYLLLDRSLRELLRHIAHPVQSSTRCAWPVTRISASKHPGAPLALDTPRGRILCQQVVVTVPLTVLQRQQLTFSPPLPAEKLQALGRLRMGNAVKVGARLSWLLLQQVCGMLLRVCCYVHPAWGSGALVIPLKHMLACDHSCGGQAGTSHSTVVRDAACGAGHIGLRPLLLAPPAVRCGLHRLLHPGVLVHALPRHRPRV